MASKNETPVRLPSASVPWQSGRTIFALMLREMGTTYGRSPGGYIWAVLEPVGMIVILSLAFSLLIHAPALGNNFTLFYATGFLPFEIYGSVAAKTAGALMFSRALLAYPSVTWMDAILARFFLAFLTLLAVFCIIMIGIMFIANTHVILDFAAIATGLLLAGLLGLSIGVMNCLLFGLYPMWKSIWGIITRPLFLASGVLFIYEDMPPLVQDILWWNPLMHITGLIRKGFYSTYHASYISIPYTLGLSLIILCMGLLFLGTHYKRVLER